MYLMYLSFCLYLSRHLTSVTATEIKTDNRSSPNFPYSSVLMKDGQEENVRQVSLQIVTTDAHLQRTLVLVSRFQTQTKF